MREARRQLAAALLDDDPRQTILGTALMTVCIGAFLFLPFDVFAESPSYRFMRYLPENLWAVVFITVGSSKIVVCLGNAHLQRCRRLRYLPFALNASTSVLWMLIWAGIVVSNPDTLGTVLYLFVALAPAWAAVRRLYSALARTGA